MGGWAEERMRADKRTGGRADKVGQWADMRTSGQERTVSKGSPKG